MDTFIDKLAQRLTAQEMIKANTAADAEELHKVQGQVKQYEAYLEEMKDVSAATLAAVNRLEQAGEASTDMIDKLEHASVGSAAAIERLEKATEAALAALSRMEQIQESSMGLADKLEHVSVAAAAASESIDQVVNAGIEKLQHAEVNTDSINELVEASLDKIKELQQDTDGMQALLRDNTNSQNETISDFVHKESVKVYRNVQAVVVEETAKQNESLEKSAKVNGGKLKAVLAVSVLALLASAGSLILQLLSLMHII